VTKFINWFVAIPNMTYPGSNVDGVAFFFWRQLWHFIGGLAVGAVAATAYLLTGWPWIVGIIAAFAALVLASTEVEDQALGQPSYKTLIDLCVWGLGFILPQLIG